MDTSASSALVDAESPWFDFIQGLVSSLAWPLVMVLAILLFHRQLLALLPDLDTLKVAGAEMSFKKRIAAVVDQAKEIEKPTADDARENDGRTQALSKMAETSPAGAILGAWTELEKAARQLIVSAGRNLPADWGVTWRYFEPTDAVETARMIGMFQLLPAAERETYEQLRRLRNRAVHEGDVTAEEARSYVKVADQLTDVLRILKSNVEKTRQ